MCPPLLFGHGPITHVGQIKWPMADFHLGQHLLFRRHAYTVTCHPAPGALWRPTLPPRDGPPFCSVLKMISTHAISWGAHKLFPLLCIPVWIFPWLLCVNVCECMRGHACMVPGCICVVFKWSFAHCRGEHDRCLLCVWNSSVLLLSLSWTLIASQYVCSVYSNVWFAKKTLLIYTYCGCFGVLWG